MRKLEAALDVMNRMEIEDLTGRRYNFKLV